MPQLWHKKRAKSLMEIKPMTSRTPGGNDLWISHLSHYIELIKMCYDDEFEQKLNIFYKCCSFHSCLW